MIFVDNLPESHGLEKLTIKPAHKLASELLILATVISVTIYTKLKSIMVADCIDGVK